MANSVDEKIRGFKTPAQQAAKPGIVLPKAFAALTTRAFASIPKGARVCCEQNIQNKFYLSWFDEDGRELNALTDRDGIDIEPIHKAARAELLAEISTDDLRAEIRRREHAEAEEIKEKAVSDGS